MESAYAVMVSCSLHMTPLALVPLPGGDRYPVCLARADGSPR
jgi:hypothetical protein